MMMNHRQSQQIKLIRASAVIMIIITHICQEYKLEFGAYFNTGVHMFLVISGFLIGQRETIDWKKWALNRVLRIFPSYYLILLLTAIAYWLFLKINIVNMQFFSHFHSLHFLFFPDYPFWGGHLWFITAVVLCYGIFPALILSTKLNKICFFISHLIIVPLLLFVLFYQTSLPYRLSGDIYCFILGFVAAKTFKQNPPNSLKFTFVFLSVMIFTGEFIALQNNYWNIKSLETFHHLLWPWKKCVYGVSACLVLYAPVVDVIAYNRLVNFIDKYSYEIYLSHKNLILGPLSLLHITGNVSLNVIAAISATLLAAYLLYKIAFFAKGILENYFTPCLTAASPVRCAFRYLKR